MRALRIHAYGGPEQLKVDEVPDPHAGPGEIRNPSAPLARASPALIESLRSTLTSAPASRR